MIDYPPAAFHPRHLCQLRGSVFPLACLMALPAAVIAVLLQYYTDHVDTEWRILGLSDKDTVAGQVWSGVSSLLGFIVVFRTSQAYSRFWDGTTSIYQMSGEWFDAASSLIAFCKCSKAEKTDVAVFQHTLVRLVSMLHAVVLMDLSANSKGEEDPNSSRAFELELIDAEGIDKESLISVNEADVKVELIFHWINQLVVENNSRKIFSVEPPILSRAFQELAGGMVRYHEAMRIARVPLPFPYVQTLELLLVLHWFSSPFLTCMWVRSEFWAGVLTFMQVFFLWSLNSIAAELENPFGEDVNDLPAQQLQQEMNKRLLLLIRPTTQRTARLGSKACLEEMRSEDGMHVQSLPHSVGLAKNGVGGAHMADSRLNRRISLGMLREAIADEAVVEVEVVEVEEMREVPSSLVDDNSPPNAEKHEPEMRRSTKRQITIRERPLCGGSMTGTTPRSFDGPASMAPSVSASMITPHGISAEAALEWQKLVQATEASRQELRQLVEICDELRDCSRTFGGQEVNGGFRAWSNTERHNFARPTESMVRETSPPRPLPDPGLNGLGGSPRSRRLSQVKAVPAEYSSCCSISSASVARGRRGSFSKHGELP